MGKLREAGLIGLIVPFTIIVVVATNNFVAFIKHFLSSEVVAMLETPFAIVMVTLFIVIGILNYKIFEKLR